MYNIVVQTVLLYRRNIWLITELVMKLLEVFHHIITRRITGKTTRRIGEGGWYFPPEEEAIKAAGMCPMWEYVWRQQSTIAEYIAKYLIS